MVKYFLNGILQFVIQCLSIIFMPVTFNKYRPSGVPVQQVVQVNNKAEKFICEYLILPNWAELTRQTGNSMLKFK